MRSAVFRLWAELSGARRSTWRAGLLPGRVERWPERPWAERVHRLARASASTPLVWLSRFPSNSCTGCPFRRAERPWWVNFK